MGEGEIMDELRRMNVIWNSLGAVSLPSNTGHFDRREKSKLMQ